MEKKTNKAKIEIFKFLRKPVESQAFDKISRKLCLLWKFNKYTLTRVFLHAEFISVMKTVQNNTVFMEMRKNNKKTSIFVN